MGFLIFMVVCCLVIPLSMAGFGRYFMHGGPKEPNALFGYRTKRSMRNGETWIFAHQYCGKLWYWIGLILIPVSAVSLAFVHGASVDGIGNAGLVLVCVQAAAMIVTVPMTEHALKKQFPEYF